MKDSGFSFLTSGPMFEFKIPDTLGDIPELSSPIVSGIGARSWVFTPSPASEDLWRGMSEEGTFIGTTTDGSGRDVEILESVDPPMFWWLRWSLRQGCLTTHLREADGLERAYKFCPSLRVLEDGPTPLLILEPPLVSLYSNRVGYQEQALFMAPKQNGWLKFVRPGFMAPGEIAIADDASGYGLLRGGVDGSVEMQLVTPGPAGDSVSDFREILESVSIT